MILCIDIGNTNIKYGLFEGDRLAVSFRGATDLKRTSDEYGTLLTNMLAIKGISPDEVKGAIISSVVPALNYTITHMCAGYLGVEPMLVGAGIKTGHNLRVDDAREVGADRIVNDVAAIRKYGAPLIVIDFGTATTFMRSTKRASSSAGRSRPACAVRSIRSFPGRQNCLAWKLKRRRASSARIRRPTYRQGWCSALRDWSIISSKKQKGK